MKSDFLRLALLLTLVATDPSRLLAGVIITAPTGGQNLPADKAQNSTNGAAFTALGNLVITEGAVTDFAAGDSQTLILTAPDGWRFNPGVGSVTFLGSRDVTAASLSVDSSTVTVTFSVKGTGKIDALTISGVQVQAVDGANVPGAGYLRRLFVNPGTATIAGIELDFTTFALLNQIPGAARALTINTQPPPATTAGALFAPQPEIGVLDQFGSLRNVDSTTVVTAARAAGSGTLQGTLSRTATFGVAAFTNLSHNVVGTITIQFTAANVAGVISQPIVVSPAPADRLVFATQPGSACAGLPFGIQPVLKTQDRFGSDSTVGLPASLPVTVSLSSGTGTLLGTTSLNIGTSAGNGVVSFANLQLDSAGTNKQLTASGSGLSNAVSSIFGVSAASYSKLQLLVPGEMPAPGTPSGKTGTPLAQSAGVPFTVTVNAVDANWNVVNTIIDTVSLTASDGNAVLPANAPLVAGTRTFNVTLMTIGSATLSASDLTDGTKSANTSSTITVGAGPPSRLAIQTQPSSTATAGTPFAQGPVIRVEDAGGNLATTDNGRSITVTRGAGTGTLQGTLTATTVNGLAAFTNLFDNLAETITLNFTATGLTGVTSANVIIGPAAASRLAFAIQPGGAYIGSPLTTQPVVQSQDQFGNASTIGLPAHLNVALSLSAGGGSLVGTTNFDMGTAAGNGVATASDLQCTSVGPGNQLTASAAGLADALSAAFIVGGVTPATGGGAISADTTGGTYTTLAGPIYYEVASGGAGTGTIVLTAPTGFVFDTGGTAPGVWINRMAGTGANANNINRVASGTLSAISSRSTSQITFTVTYASSGGVACSLTWTNVRVRPLAGAPLAAGDLTALGTAVLGGVAAGTTSFGSLTETAGVASRLAFTTQPGMATAGAPFGLQPVVQARDRFGNNSTAGLPASKVVTITLSAGTGPLLGTTSQDLGTAAGNGVATFTDLELDSALTTKQLTASAAGFTNVVSSVFTVSPAAASRLGFQTQPSANATAGVVFAQQPVIRIEDQFGNLCTLNTGTIITAARNGGAGVLQGATSVGSVNGIASFADLSHLVAGTITIDFAGAGLAGATSGNIAVAPATAARLTLQTPPPATATAGVAFAQQPVVRIEDVYGNLRSGDNSTVMTATRGAGAGTLQGATSVVASGGIVAFTNLFHTVATNITVQFATASLSVTSGPIAVSPAAASKLVFVAQPGSSTAGSPLSVQPSVKTQDPYGNDSAGGLPPSLNVALALTSGTGPLQGTTALDIGANAGAGLVGFTNLQIDAAGTNKQLTASAPGLTSALSAVFAVSPAAATSLALQTPPSSTATAGSAFAQQPVIRITDPFGNLASGDNTTVVSVGLASGSAPLLGSTSARAVGGLVTFTNLSYNLAETITLSFSGGTLADVVSGPITVSAAAASRLIIATQPSATATAGVVFAQQPVIRVEDRYGNLRSTDNATLVTAARAAGAGTLQGTTSVAAFNGLVSFDDLSHNVATNITLQFTSPGLTNAISSAIAVAPAAASQLALQTQPAATATAGAAFAPQPVVRIEDPFGNLIAGDNGTVITASRGAGNGMLQGTTSAPTANGLASFTDLSYNLAETITVAFASGSLTPVTSANVVVKPAAFAKLQLLVPGETAAPATVSGKLGTPSVQRAGIAFAVTVNAVDSYWNVVGTNDTIATTSSDANAALPANAALASGTRNFNVTLKTAGSATVTAADVTHPAIVGSTSPTVTVDPGAFSKLLVLLPGESSAPGTLTGKTGTPTVQTAGTPFSVTANATDDNWNPVTTPGDTVAVTSSDANAILPANAALVAGTKTFSVTARTSGSQTVTISDLTDGSKASSTSSPVTVNTGVFTRLQLLAPGETAAPGTLSGKTGTPTAQAAGLSFNLTVNAVDANWNVVNTVSDAVSLAASDSNATLPANAALASGTRSFSVTLKTAGSATVTATDLSDGSKAANTSPAIPVNAGALARLQVLVPGEVAVPGTATGKTGSPAAQIAGTAFSVTVNAVDANWNLVATNDTVALDASDANALLPANAALSGGSRSLSVTLKTAGSATVSATDVTHGAVTANTSPAISVAPGSFAQLQVLVPGETAAPGSATGKTGTPAAQVADSPFSVTVNAVDANWNPVSDVTDLVRLSASDSNALLPADAGLVAGQQTFNVTLSTLGSATLTASDLTDNTKASSTSSAISVVAAQYVAATGGDPISADTTGGAYSALTGPTYSENASGNVGTGTIILKAPAGFLFDNGGTFPTVLITRLTGSGSSANNINGVTSLTAVPMTSVTTTQLVFTVTSRSANGITCKLTWQNVRVRPAAGTPLADGNLSVGGTATVVGVSTNSRLGRLRETPGAAARLALQTQPADSAVAGVVFAPQPVVQVQDQFGNLRTNDNSVVVTATRLAGSGTLQGATTGRAVGGLVAFTNLSHTVATNITIRFTSGSLSNVTSAIVAVGPAPADHLDFTTQPGSATYGSALSPQPVVKSRDPFGNDSAVGLDPNEMVTLTVSAGGGALLGTASLNIGTAGGNGTAAFAGLQVGAAGTGKQLTASGAGLVSAVSSSFAVNKATVSGSITANNKIYDGTTAATIATRALSGVVGSDAVSLSGGTATFASKTVGAAKTVTATGLSLSGADAANYQLASTTASATAAITARPLLVSAAGVNKVYDGTMAATVTLSDNRVPGDSLSASYASASFADKTVGLAKAVSVSGIALSGTDAGNYTFNTTASAAADITARSLTVAATGVNKVYDGTASATVSLSDNRVAGDTLSTSYGSASFANKNVGTGKAVSVSGITTSGTDAANYTANSTAATTAAITTRTLAVSATGVDKVYDGTTSATVALSDDRVAGDSLSTSYTSASFANKNVGAGKAVSVSGIALGGADAANYRANTTAGTTADITARALTVTATGVNKVYDGSSSATVTLSDDRLSGDSLGTSYASASFANTSVGAAKPVAVSGIALSGPDAANYTCNPTARATADITAKPLTVSGISANSKVYNGSTLAVLNAGSAGLVGVVSGDNVTLNTGSAAGAFADKNAGNGKTVTVSGLTMSGADAANYSLTPPVTTANITPAGLTVTADDKSRAAGQPNPTLTATYAGFVVGETLATSGVTGSPALSATTTNVVGVYPITAAVGTLNAVNYAFTFVNGQLTVTPAAASKLVFTSAPQTFTAGTTCGVIAVERQDAFNNPNTTDAAITVNLSSDSAGAYAFRNTADTTTITSVTIAGGSSSASFKYTDPTAGTPTITAAKSGLSSATQTQTVAAGAFTRLQLLVPGESAAPGTLSGKTGTPTAQAAGTAFNVTVNAVDVNWNVVNSVGDTVGLSVSDSNATPPANAALAAGTGSFSLTLKTAGSATLSATDLTDGGKSASTSPAITVNAGALAKLQIVVPGETEVPGTLTGKSGTPVGQVAGVAFSVTVNAVDANWNLVATNDTVALDASDANALLPANAALSGGSRSLSVTLKTAGSATVSATDVTHGAVTANTSPAISVAPGSFAQLQVLVPGETAAPGSATGKTGTPAAQVADSPFSVTVNAVDANWNPVSDVTDLVRLSASDSNALLPADAGLVAGQQTFNVTLNTLGSATLTASDLTDLSKGADTSSVLSVISPQYVAAIGGDPLSADTAGGAYTALTGPSYSEKASGDVGTGTIILKAPAGFLFDTGGTAPTVLITRLTGSGSSANNINDVSSLTAVPMTSVSSTQLVFTVTSSSVNGITCKLTWQNVRVRPAAGTPLADGNLSVGGTATVVGVSANSKLGRLREAVGVAAQLALQTQPADTAMAGVVFAPQPVVQVQDQFGNLRTNDNTVVVTATRLAGSGTLQGATTGRAVGGLVAFTNLSHTVATNITIRFTSGSLSNVTSAIVAVGPAPADHLDFTTQPGDGTVGAPLQVQPVIRSRDAFGNDSTVGLGDTKNVAVALSSGSGPLLGKTSLDIGAAAGNGVVSFMNLEVDSAGTNKQLTASATGLSDAVSSVFSIGKNTQTITFSALANKTYGNAPFVLSATASSGLTVSFSVVSGPATVAANTLAITGAGTVTVRASQNGDNYWAAASPVDQTFTVAKAALTVTADNKTRVYGAANPPLTASYSGFVNGENASVLAGAPSLSTAATSGSPVAGSPYTIAVGAGTLGASNYNFNFVAGSLTITKATLTVRAQDKSRTYGTANPALTASYSGFVNGETASVLTGSPSLSTIATAGSPVAGSPYPIAVQPGTLTAANYAFSMVNGSLAILPAALSVRAGDAVRPYGQTNPVFNGTLTGVWSGDNITANYGTSATNTSPVGAYAIVPALLDPDGRLGNYTVSATNGTLTVIAAQLVGRVDDTSRAYGQSNPAFTVQYSGFVNGEDASLLTGAFVGTTPATASSPVGVYPISGSGQSASNYLVTYVSGALTVTPHALSVVANNASRVYGDANPALSGTLTGVQPGDNITASYSTAATAGSPVGAYPIVPSLSDPNGKLTNYTVSATSGTLTVAPAALTVAASNATRAYGQANPVFSGILSAVRLGDNITASYATAATAGSPAGAYPIIPDLSDPDGKLSNYTVSSANGTLTITKVTLTVTADNQSRIYGAPNPAFTVSYNGFINGDTASVLSGNPALNTTANMGSSVAGSPYAITVSQGTLAATNYTFAFVSGQLTVTPASAAAVVASSANPAPTGSNVTFTASLTGVAPSAGVPTGTVQFIADGSALGAPVNLGGGVASASLATLSHGVHTISAAYAGDGNFLGTTNDLGASQVINSLPAATLATYVRTINAWMQIAIPDFMTNHTSDADGDPITLVSVGSGTNGATVLLFGGSIYYLPSNTDPNRNTTDYLDYVVSDGFPGGTVTNYICINLDTSVAAGPATLTSLSVGTNQVRLTFSGSPNSTYHVEQAAALGAGNTVWQELGSATTDGVGLGVFTATNAPANQAYYRAVWR